jgi:hypothetical protein
MTSSNGRSQWLGAVLCGVGFVVGSYAAQTTLDGAGPSRFLAVWTGDEDRRHPDFLAILDVSPQGPRYGKVITTLPVGFSALDPHHTEHALEPGRILFANGYAGDRSFRFDLRQPQRPRLLGSLDTGSDVHYLHSFVRAPGGRVLATYQAEGPNREGAGGIAEFSLDGRLVRKSSARVEGIEPALLRPYSMAVVPVLDRIVVGCSAMLFPATWDEPHAKAMRTQMEHEHRGIHVQVYRLSDLKLLETVALPEESQDARITGAKEPRLLEDGRTVLMSTGDGALFKIDHLESRPAITRVHTFGEERCACGVPVVVGHFWMQPMANAHAILSLDVADPAHPKEVSRVRLGDRLLAHWLSWDPGGNRLIVADSGAPGGEHRLWIVALDPTTGHLEVDRRFGNPGSDEPGFSFDTPQWPHGATGPAVPHGTVFVP